MNWLAACAIPDSHPSIPGHFPDHPVVPGVVLLEQVLDVVRHQIPEFALAGIPKTKFFRALQPGLEFEIAIEWSGVTVSFECRDAIGVFVRGILEQQLPDS